MVVDPEPAALTILTLYEVLPDKAVGVPVISPVVGLKFNPAGSAGLIDSDVIG